MWNIMWNGSLSLTTTLEKNQHKNLFLPFILMSVIHCLEYNCYMWQSSVIIAYYIFVSIDRFRFDGGSVNIWKQKQSEISHISFLFHKYVLLLFW